MNPCGINADVKGTGLASVSLPTCSVANQDIDTGGRARCFASYIRIHALEATGGRTYSQMGQYLTARQGDQRQGPGRQGPEDRPAACRTAPATSGSRPPR